MPFFNKNYFERLAPIKRATTRTMVAGFFIAFLIASLVWFTRNFGMKINDKRLKIIESYKNDSINANDQSKVEDADNLIKEKPSSDNSQVAP